MLSIGIQQPSYTVIPIIFGSDFGVLGHLWSQNDVNTSWLRLTATSNCFPHPYYAYTKCLSTFICCALTTSSSLTQLYPSYVTWHTVAASNTFYIFAQQAASHAERVRTTPQRGRTTGGVTMATGEPRDDNGDVNAPAVRATDC
jgi:hypothetical protein